MSKLRRRWGRIVAPRPIATGSQSGNWGHDLGRRRFSLRWTDEIESVPTGTYWSYVPTGAFCTGNRVRIEMYV
jgi:hypothetical protein